MYNNGVNTFEKGHPQKRQKTDELLDFFPIRQFSKVLRQKWFDFVEQYKHGSCLDLLL